MRLFAGERRVFEEGDVVLGMKIVAVLNKELESGVALNAAAHMALGLSARAARERPAILDSMMFQDYRDKDNKPYPFISGLSLIVLRAKANEIKKLDDQCRENGLLSTAFVRDMTGDTYIEQLERLKNCPSADVSYYGLCTIAEKDVLDPLTKRFSLWH